MQLSPSPPVPPPPRAADLTAHERTVHGGNPAQRLLLSNTAWLFRPASLTHPPTQHPTSAPSSSAQLDRDEASFHLESLGAGEHAAWAALVRKPSSSSVGQQACEGDAEEEEEEGELVLYSPLQSPPETPRLAHVGGGGQAGGRDDGGEC